MGEGIVRVDESNAKRQEMIVENGEDMYPICNRGFPFKHSFSRDLDSYYSVSTMNLQEDIKSSHTGA